MCTSEFFSDFSFISGSPTRQFVSQKRTAADSSEISPDPILCKDQVSTSRSILVENTLSEYTIGKGSDDDLESNEMDYDSDRVPGSPSAEIASKVKSKVSSNFTEGKP